MTAMPMPDVWEGLFRKALTLIEEIARHGTPDPFWTFGGGTVLMLRYGHRQSKDIDIFVPDPQYLGFITPRLSDKAESLTQHYTEAANYVKLYFPEGEIDFVAAPNLTAPGYELQTLMGHATKMETSAEIIAKKLWHRGDAITGRDIFDFALVAEKEPQGLRTAAKFLLRHAEAMYRALDERAIPLKIQFDAIDTLNYHPVFEDACDILRATLIAMQSDLDGPNVE